MTEAEILDEFKAARRAIDSAWNKLEDHFGPLIDAALAVNDYKKARAILARIPESPCRFMQWQKIEAVDPTPDPGNVDAYVNLIHEGAARRRTL